MIQIEVLKTDWNKYGYIPIFKEPKNQDVCEKEVLSYANIIAEGENEVELNLVENGEYMTKALSKSEGPIRLTFQMHEYWYNDFYEPTNEVVTVSKYGSEPSISYY